jgi:hypothetical protein
MLVVNMGVAGELESAHGLLELGLTVGEGVAGPTELAEGIDGRFGKTSGPVWPQAVSNTQRQSGLKLLTRIRVLLNMCKL